MLNSKIKNTLIASPLSQYLNSSEIDTLLPYTDLVSFASGDVILEQGEYSPGIYIIIKGTALRTARTLELDMAKLALLSDGDFMGEIGFLNNEPSYTSIIANTPVTALLINKAYWDFLSAFLPDEKFKIMLAIAKRICERMKNTHEKIISYIHESDMAIQPILGKVIESLKKPAVTTFEEAEIDKNKLHSAEIFSSFNNEEYEELLKRLVVIKAGKHCPIIKETDNQSGCYIVLRGAVQSNVIHDNVIAKLSVVGPVAMFSSVSTVDPAWPSLVNYTTCEQVILLKFPQSELEFIQTNNKLLWDKLFSLICRSLVVLEKSVHKLNIRLNIELYNR